MGGGLGGEIREELIFKGYLECDFVCLEAEVSNIVPFCREREKWNIFKGLKVNNWKEVLIIVP